MIRLSFISLLILLIFCLSDISIATTLSIDDLPGPMGSLRGSVTTRDGRPAPFVTIQVKAQNKGVLTDEAGQFTLRHLAPGVCVVTASVVGLTEQTQTLTIVAGQTTTIHMILAEDTKQLSEVLVKAYKSDNQRPVSLGKVNIRPLDLPQAVTVIDREVLERQQVLRLSDALMNANGVYVMGTTGGTQEEIAGRGFAFNSSNTFKNGARFNNAAMPELSALERVEILKGSAAILFGNVAAGGILNLVTKKPRFEQGGSVSMRAGSYDFYKPSVDVYGGIGKANRVAYRLNTTYENSRSFRDVVQGERVYVNPSLLFKISDRTELLVEGDYLRDRRTADFGIGSINYTVPDVPRSQFLGVTWSYNRIDQQSATATLTHQFSDRWPGREWQIRGMVSGQNYRSDLFANQRPNGNSQAIKANGDWIRGLQRTSIDETYAITQIDLTGRFQTGRINHTLLFGADADRYRTNTTAYNPLNIYDTLNIFTPTKFRQRTDIPILTTRTLTTASIDRAGVYVQDLLAFSQKIKLLAGLRYSYQQTGSNVLTYADSKTTSVYTYDDAVTPRVGLVIQPRPTTSLFVSYANSFAVNTGVDVLGNALPPSFIDQYEAGWKNDLFSGKLSANLTLYQIKNSNLAQISLENGNTNTNIKELAGEVTSRGLEVDVKTRAIGGFSVLAGYSYNRTFYSQSNTFIVGSLLRYNPNHTANASLYYAVPGSGWAKGLNLGLTAFYMGERQAGRSTRLTVANDAYRLIPLPAYVQLDASVGYSLPRFSVRAKLSNLLNALSYNVHDDNSINPIAPRMLSVTTSWRW